MERIECTATKVTTLDPDVRPEPVEVRVVARTDDGVVLSVATPGPTLWTVSLRPQDARVLATELERASRS
jgi:hypothetical protein